MKATHRALHKFAVLLSLPAYRCSHLEDSGRKCTPCPSCEKVATCELFVRCSTFEYSKRLQLVFKRRRSIVIMINCGLKKNETPIWNVYLIHSVMWKRTCFEANMKMEKATLPPFHSSNHHSTQGVYSEITFYHSNKHDWWRNPRKREYYHSKSSAEIPSPSNSNSSSSSRPSSKSASSSSSSSKPNCLS